MNLTEKHIGKRVRRVGNRPCEGVLYKVDGISAHLLGEGTWTAHDDDNLGTWELVEPGLSLREAIASGKLFRPVGGKWADGTECDVWFIANCGKHAKVVDGSGEFMTIDAVVLDARYELKPEKTATVTAEQLRTLRREYVANTDGFQFQVDYFIHKLGLE